MDTYRTYLNDPLCGARHIADHRFAAVSATLVVTARERCQDGLLRREVEFTLQRPEQGPVTRSIFWEIDTPLELPAIGSLDYAALATVFIAMRERAHLVIDGPVTATMLRNLEELNEAWHQLLPERYALISIRATEILSDVPPARPGQSRAVVAFSGGIDACFTLIRHLSGHAGHRTAVVATAVLVHGFDIPLSAPAAFEKARTSAKVALDAVGVPLSTIRTNWREVAETSWEMDHMAALASALHQFAGTCDLGLFGSDLTHIFHFWPWGSQPGLDCYLSGGRFVMRAEGQGFERSARTELVAAVPALSDRLRVCWAGPLTGENCGVCEKCVRTQLNYLAIGHDPGPAFPVRAGLLDVLCLNARHAAQVNYLIDILESARRHRVTGPWRQAVLLNWLVNRALLPYRADVDKWLAPIRFIRRLLLTRFRGSTHGRNVIASPGLATALVGAVASSPPGGGAAPT
jgi:hypothetical protein